MGQQGQSTFTHLACDQNSPFSASQVVEITAVSHHPQPKFFFCDHCTVVIEENVLLENTHLKYLENRKRLQVISNGSKVIII
jgi:hypothetical protein